MGKIALLADFFLYNLIDFLFLNKISDRNEHEKELVAYFAATVCICGL